MPSPRKTAVDAPTKQFIKVHNITYFNGADMASQQTCDLFASAILQLRRDILEDQRQVAALRQLLDARQHRTKPDPAQIKMLTSRLEQAEQKLAEDQAQLTAFTEEFEADCPPRPDI